MFDENAIAQTWDKVADEYVEEIGEQEKQLYQEIRSLLDTIKILPGDRLLETGSGSGHLSLLLNQDGYHTDLLDFSSNSLKKSKEFFDNKGLKAEFIQADLVQPISIDKEYDLVWNSGVLEHFEEKVLSEIIGNLVQLNAKKYLFIMPNPESFPYLLYRHKLIGEGLWNCGMEYLQENYEKIFAQKGLRIVRTEYLATRWTVDHLGIFLGDMEKSEFLEEMFKCEVVKSNQKYLVAYVLEKDQVEDTEIETVNSLVDSKSKTIIFDLISEKQGLKNKTKELKNKIRECNSRIHELETSKKFLEEQTNQLLQDQNLLTDCNNKLIAEKDKLIKMCDKLTVEKDSLSKKDNELGELREKIAVNEQQIHYYETERINLLNQYTQNTHQIVQEIEAINMLKPYRLAHAIRRLKFQFLKGNSGERKEYISWMKRKIRKVRVAEDNTYNPLHHLKNTVLNIGSSAAVPNEGQVELQTSVQSNVGEFEARQEYFRKYLNLDKDKNVETIEEFLKESTYKGIFVYPKAIKWEPVQRPHHFLRELGKEGYLCIFLDESKEDTKQLIEEKYENVYIIYDEAAALYALKNYYVGILCTWIYQLAWAELLPNKFIWYDILDEIDFLSGYNNLYKEKHSQLVEKADRVSYSAKALEKYINNRSDAKLIPNGVNTEDFTSQNYGSVDQMEKLKSKQIIGYYGAIEEWLDIDIIKYLANQNKDKEIVLIGDVRIDTDTLSKIDNIHFMGAIAYDELKDYSQYFNVAIIPFKVNTLTNSVSPVKFFEYSALGKPVVSTPIKEMQQYASDWVLLAEDKVEFNKMVQKALTESVQENARIEGIKLAKQNDWKERVEAIIKDHLDYNQLKLNANINVLNAINVFTPTFLDYEGHNFYAGGAERYLIDLAEICNKRNIAFNVFQYGNFSWVRKFKDFNVISVNNKKEKVVHSVEQNNRFSKSFYEQASNSLMTIYSPFFILGRPSNNSVGISHGVAWDSEFVKFENGYDFWNSNKNIIESAKILDNIVSVDTNTANWFQTIDYSVGKKIKVVPNYVDRTIFTPKEKKEDKKIVISYPRRLYGARGLYMTLNVIDEILEKYEQVEFHFIGRGFPEDTKHVEDKIKKWGERVQWYSLLPEEMPKAYDVSDIVLIPTMYSEGTSLSCLEAMASGKAIVATRVGGLTDLIIDRFNGRLIDLDEEQLKESLVEMIEDTQKREMYGRNALEVSKAFSKETWDIKWENIFNQFIAGQVGTTNKPKYFKIYKDKMIKDVELKEAIEYLLKQGHFVTVKTSKESEVSQYSYGRLQFEMDNKDNYYDHADYVVTNDSSQLKEGEKLVTLQAIYSLSN